jgi:hypothetical protein
MIRAIVSVDYVGGCDAPMCLSKVSELRPVGLFWMDGMTMMMMVVA